MQMARVETSAADAICAEPSRMDCSSSFAAFQIAVDVLESDSGVIHQDSRRPTRSAQGHNVDGLRAAMARMLSEQRIESGMETAMMSVERQLPRKTRIMIAVRPGGDDGFADHAVDGSTHKDRLGRESVLNCNCGGSVPLMSMSFFCTPLMMSSVEDEPIFMTVKQCGTLAVDADDVGCEDCRRARGSHRRI